MSPSWGSILAGEGQPTLALGGRNSPSPAGGGSHFLSGSRARGAGRGGVPTGWPAPPFLGRKGTQWGEPDALALECLGPRGGAWEELGRQERACGPPSRRGWGGGGGALRLRVSSLCVGRWGGRSAGSPPGKERALRPSSPITWHRRWGGQGGHGGAPRLPPTPANPIIPLPAARSGPRGLDSPPLWLHACSSCPSCPPPSSGRLQLQGPGDCPARSSPGAWPGGGGALLSSSWDQGAPATSDPRPSPPVQLLAALRGGSQSPGGRNLPRAAPAGAPVSLLVPGGRGSGAFDAGGRASGQG